MSVERIKAALEKMSREERRVVMDFLADLKRGRDAAHSAELSAERDNCDPANWVPLAEVKKQLRELEDSEAGCKL